MTPEQLNQLLDELEKLTHPIRVITLGEPGGAERVAVREQQRRDKIEQAFSILLNILREYIREQAVTKTDKEV